PSVMTGGFAVGPILILAALNAADELDRSAFGVLLPEIRDYFGVSLGTILTVVAIAGIVPYLVALGIGWYADRFNRKLLVIIGSFTWVLFSVLTGFAPTLFFLGLFRMGSELGKVTEPAQSSLISDLYPPDRRAGVYALFVAGNSVGLIVAPTVAGFLASWFFWQAPFLVFGIPSLILSVLAIRVLREPVRGEQERRALGVDESIVATEEAPPTWTESWRIAKGVRTLRRIWLSLPFLAGSILGLPALMTVYYDEVFHVTERGRGLIASSVAAAGLIGILVGGALGNRLHVKKPGRIIIYSASLGMVPTVGYAIVAASPWLWLSIIASLIAAVISVALVPQLLAMISRVIPPRARGFAISGGLLFIAPGLLVPAFAGTIGDHLGLRVGILVMVFMYGLGTIILGSSGLSVEADIRAATAAALAAEHSRDAKAAGAAKLLVCRDVDVHYGQVQILFGVDFDVEEGEIVALLGTNGAGKSTLLNAIAGVAPASNGAVFFDGEEVTFLPASDHVDRGIVMVPGGKGVFPTLSVGENLKLAAWPYRDDEDHVRAATERVFEFFPRLRERLNETAGSLSGGEQQMLTLGQAFIAKPRLLMIDELSLGLAPAVVEQLLDIVRQIHEQGCTILLVEQSVNIALTVANRAYFLEKGEVRFSGPTAELLERGDILRSVFLAGSGAGSRLRVKRERAPWEEEPDQVLSVQGIARSFGGIAALRDVDLVLREGEILGIIGPNGAGKTTLFDVISGFVTPDAGTITLLGDDITNIGPDQRARQGIQRSFQDARLFPALSVEENLLVAIDRHLSNKNALFAGLRLPQSTKAEARLRKRAERLIMVLGLGAFRDKQVRELSTGTRRLVDLACVLGTDPTVLLLDEPSSGVAQRETEELGPVIQRIKSETACSILVIEH
ncbi:MAG: branched-chain amino acid transport system ATP-binding protein livF, partial [Actinomycetota bacterium]|nr:branched-chain amino acid transport system ATP-binding protein livF [Actinomycetota bacterium]